jgi:predicted ferric reductase
MSEDLAPSQKADLYYSVRDEEDLVSMNTFKSVEKANKNFRLFAWITSKKGHLTINDIQKNTGNLKDKEYYLCGSIGFKEGIKNDLMKLGVSKEKIYEEAFNFR